eukprot:1181688-Amphidinium_carterae.2
MAPCVGTLPLRMLPFVVQEFPIISVCAQQVRLASSILRVAKRISDNDKQKDRQKLRWRAQVPKRCDAAKSQAKKDR